MVEKNNKIKEQWNFIFKVFPLVDLPFNALAIYSSNHWQISLAIAIIIPIVASSILYFSEKKNFQPGYWILAINGLLFFPYMYYSGAQSANMVNFNKHDSGFIFYVSKL